MCKVEFERFRGCVYKDFLILTGGRDKQFNQNKSVFTFSLVTLEWSCIIMENIIEVDSHILLSVEREDLLLQIGGYSRNHGYLNCVTAFKIEMNSKQIKLNPLSVEIRGHNVLPKRICSSGIELKNKEIVVFGGTCDNITYNDIWTLSYEISSSKLIGSWSQVVIPNLQLDVLVC